MMKQPQINLAYNNNVRKSS